MRKSFFKKLSLGMALALVLGTTAHAGVAQAAEAWTLKTNSKILYLNADNVKGTPNFYDFNFKNKPDGWKDDYSFAWSIADEEVATVAKGGVVTAVSVGETVVSCQVTNKETKEVVAVVTADVTVKANAADVEITNKADFEGVELPTGATIDLSRAMWDENGNRTTKRGEYVTDYTRWAATVAEPNADGSFSQVSADVVTVKQATGEFTFHVAGTYKLWCETYQSSKNDQTIAQDTMVVTVVDPVVEQTYTVEQSKVNELLILFDNPVDAKAEGYVEADFVKAIEDTLKIEVKVDEDTDADVSFKDVSAYYGKDDKKDVLYGVKVTLWDNFENKGVYTITFNEDEKFELTASVGQPASVVVKVENPINKDLTNVVYVTSENQEENKITFAYKDAFGIDVTSATVTGTTYVDFVAANEDDEYFFDISFNEEEGVAYLTVDEGANGKKGFVTVDYKEYDEEEGDEVTVFSYKFEVVAKDAPAVTLKADKVGLVAGTAIADHGADVTFTNKIAANDDGKMFTVWATNNWGKKVTNGEDGFTYKLSNDKAAIDEDGVFVPYAAGTVKVSVYYADPNVDDAKAKKVTEFTVQILSDRAVDDMVVTKGTTNLTANVVKDVTFDKIEDNIVYNEQFKAPEGWLEDGIVEDYNPKKDHIGDEFKVVADGVDLSNIAETATWEVKLYDNFDEQWKENKLVTFKDIESYFYFDINYSDGTYTVTLKNNNPYVVDLLTNKENAEKGTVTISADLVLTKADGTTVEKTISAKLKKPATLKVKEYKVEVADVNVGMLDANTAKTKVELVAYNDKGVKVWNIDTLKYVPYGNKSSVKENLDKIGADVLADVATGSVLVYTITGKNGKDIIDASDLGSGKINPENDKVISIIGHVMEATGSTIQLAGCYMSDVVSGAAIVLKPVASEYTVTVYEITKSVDGETVKYAFDEKDSDTFKVTDAPVAVTVAVNKNKTDVTVDNTENNALEWTTRKDVRDAILDCMTIKVGDKDAKDYNMVFEVRSNGKTMYVKTVRIYAPALDKDGEATSGQYVILEKSIGQVITLGEE